jgi:hypothetical protein
MRFSIAANISPKAGPNPTFCGITMRGGAAADAYNGVARPPQVRLSKPLKTTRLQEVYAPFKSDELQANVDRVFKEKPPLVPELPGTC